MPIQGGRILRAASRRAVIRGCQQRLDDVSAQHGHETDIVSQLVSRREIELGIVVITQILTTDGVSLAKPLPSEIQSYITFTGGISTNSQSADAAIELLRALKWPRAISVMRSQGMEPP
jgi:ABC-type molybdate transport system substrate-binding protein